MAQKNLNIVLANRPKDEIVPGETFKKEYQPIPKAEDLKDGEVLVENLYLSLEPAMRTWLNDARSYVEPVKVGDVMRGYAVSRVLASKSKKVLEGDVIPTQAGWVEYAVVSDEMLQPSSSYPPVSRPSDYLSSIGGTALTAYFGMLNIGEPKAGETVVVSGAAGATGSVAGQIAKLKGARVVGIAGSQEKCKVLTEELGFDVALNYKDAAFKKQFKEATPDMIDVYFDNVGGDILDMCLGRAKEHARFVICGGISQYNSSTPQGPKNFGSIIAMRIKLQGFIVLDYMKEFRSARQQLAKWLEEGKIKRKETIVTGGLENAEQALADLYKGINTGKLLVEIKNPKESSKL